MPAISESVAVDHPTSHGVEENRMSVTGSAGPKDDSPDMGGSSERKVVWSVQDEGTVSMVESAAPSEGGNHTPSQLPLLKRKVSRGNSMNGRHPHIVDGEVVSVPIIIKDRLQKKLGFDNNQLEYMMKIRSIFDDIDYDALGFLTWPNLIRVRRPSSLPFFITSVLPFAGSLTSLISDDVPPSLSFPQVSGTSLRVLLSISPDTVSNPAR